MRDEPTRTDAGDGAARSLGFVLVAGCAFAASGPLARWARPADPMVVAFGRCALAALVLCLVEARHLVATARALGLARLGGVLGAGVLLGVHLALFLVGLDRTSLPAAVALVSLEPLSVVLWSWALHGLRPTRREQLGVLLATAGAAIVATATGTGEHRLAGDLLVLAAVVTYGPYVASSRFHAAHLPARRYSALVYLGAAVTTGIAVLATANGRATLLGPLPPHALVAIAGIALLPTLVGHTAVQAAARRLSPSVVALVSPMETLGAIAIGAALLHVVPSLREGMGAMVIIAGVCVAVVRSAATAGKGESETG